MSQYVFEMVRSKCFASLVHSPCNFPRCGLIKTDMEIPSRDKSTSAHNTSTTSFSMSQEVESRGFRFVRFLFSTSFSISHGI